MIRFGLHQEVMLPFDTVLKRLPQELKRKGFEVLSTTRIDNEFRKYLGVDFKHYAILSVSNLQLAYKALLRDESFGLVLYSTVIIYEKGDMTIVRATRPSQSMPALINELLNEDSAVMERKMTEVLDTLGKKRFLKEKKKEQSSCLERAVA